MVWQIQRLLALILDILLIGLVLLILLWITAKGVNFLLGITFLGLWQRIIAIPVSALTPLVAFTAALVALLVWIWNIRRQYSEDLLKESKSFFEKAFATLNVLDDQGRPLNQRMRWLTSARLLRTAQQMGAKIEMESHRFLYKEIEEYWRSKFRDIIEPQDEGFPEDYFAEQPEHFSCYSQCREPLALSSIRLIYRFVRWPEGRSDPLHNEPPFSEEELREMEVIGPRNLARLLRRNNEHFRAHGLR